MFKKIFWYAVICFLVFIASYTLHNLIAQTKEITFPFELWKIYLFQALTTFSLCTVFEIIAQKIESLKDQLGFLYLAFMVIKIGLFCIVFKNILFSNLVLSKTESFSLLVPVLIFLLTEVYLIAKILNRNQ